jgi:hypothetical protein
MKGSLMKNNPTVIHKIITSQIRRFVPLLTGLATLGGLMLSQGAARAQANVLTDPGAETAVDHSGTFTGWTQWGGGGAFVGDATDPGVAAYDGTQYFKIYGNYGNATDYSGFFQTFGAHAGQIYNAGGYICQNSGDGFGSGDGNNCYLEVQFKDINGNILANYQSAHYVSGSPQNEWLSLSVTNETAPTPGMVSSLIAPANTVLVEYDVVFNLVNYGGGSVYLDDLSLLSTAPPAPYVTNLAPANVIQSTNRNFTFGAVALSGNITNLQVTVTAISGLVYPTTNIYTYTTPSTNLTVIGLNTPSATASIPLSSNVTYSITVLATDSNAGTAVGTANFDTIVPVFVFEAEDFNYSSGQYIATPTDGGVNLYAGLVGTPGIDESWINNSSQSDLYRTSDAVSIGGAYETPRQKFLDAVADGNTNALDYEVGYNTVGDWENYTRTFPTGTYNIYARMAVSGAGNQVTLGIVGGDPTSGTQTVTNLGVCNVSGNNWNQYFYCPLVDSFGNLITVHLSGTETIRSTVSAGGPNINFYMVVPATGSPYPGLVSSYPTGAHPFEPTNKFSFTIGPANGSPINSSAIGLTLNGLNLTSQLTLSAGPSGTWTASVPISPSTIYSAVITATNTTSLSSTFTINFDTFSQNNFMWEAEDFDFNGGQFIDNAIPSYDPTIAGGGLLETNSYCGFPGGNSANTDIAGIDDGWLYASGESTVYRVSSVSTQVASDYLRQKFLISQTNLDDVNIADVNIGYWNAGSWMNYTRTYPAGRYYIWGRLAGGAGPFSGTTLAVVTNGVGTSDQGTNILGTFADPNAAGWQSWHWVELLDTNGNPAVATFNGVTTLQIESGGDINANYYMLAPAPSVAGAVLLSVSLSGLEPVISFPTQAGFNYTLLYKNNLSDPTWSNLTSVAGDGTTKALTDSTATGVTQRFYRVSAQ